jgi:hypothetical protein
VGEAANAEAAEVPVVANGEIEPLSDQNADQQGAGEHEVDPEREEQRRRSRDIIDNALRVGYWSERDATSFQSLVHELDADERGNLMQELAIAFNAGRLRYDGAGPAF